MSLVYKGNVKNHIDSEFLLTYSEGTLTIT